jgi:hypothetical protein
MTKSIILSISITILGLFMVLNCIAAPLVYAEKAVVEFYTSPSQISLDASTTPLGYRFNVTVMWKDSGSPLNEVYAYQATLKYNATLLNCTRAWRPTWDSTWLFYGKSVVGLLPAYGVGFVTVGDSLMGVDSASSALSPLAVFELEIRMAPPEGGQVSSVLGIDNVDTYWLDYDLNEGPLLKTNGNYTIPEFSHVALIIAFLALCSLPMILRKTKRAAIRTGTLAAN